MTTKDLYPIQLAQADKVELAQDLIVRQCKSGSIALDTTCILSGYSKETLADKISKPREVLSRACNGRGGLDIDVLINLIRESGSALILQYMAQKLGGEFRFLSQDEIEIKQTEDHLAMLKAKRAA